MRQVALLSSIILGMISTLQADQPTQITTLDGTFQSAAKIEFVSDPDRIKWEHTEKQNGKLKGTIPLSEIMSLRFPAEAPKQVPIEITRKVMAGPWQMPDKFAKGKPVNSAETRKFETIAVKHENEEATTAMFTGTLHLPVSGNWTIQAIAPDHLGMLIDGQSTLTPDTPDFTATSKLEAGERNISISVPSSKKRIYEIKISGPGFDGDLANLLVAGAPKWNVTLANGSKLIGTRGKRTATTQAFSCAAGEIELKWNHIKTLTLNSPESIQLLRETPDNEDTVLVASGERIVELHAKILGMDATHVRVNHDGTERKISHDRIIAFRRGTISTQKTPTDNAMVHLSDGSKLRGKIQAITKEHAILFGIGANPKNPITIKSGIASELLLDQAGCTFLSELTPTKVEQRAWFDYPVHWRKDQGFAQPRPTVRTASFGHALALHAYTRFELPVSPSPRRFLSAVGIEHGAPPEASAAVRVLSGGRVVAENKALTPASELWQIDVPVATNEQLILEVDFGANEDIGDKVIFGDARFLTEEIKK